jgi:hypothetical protein
MGYLGILVFFVLMVLNLLCAILQFWLVDHDDPSKVNTHLAIGLFNSLVFAFMALSIPRLWL